jgi:parallel beta-helix repeat protein
MCALKTFFGVLSIILVLSLPLSGGDEDLRLKWNQFRSDFEGNCSIVWNSRTGGAKRIIGSSIFLDSKSIDRQNIADFADAFTMRYSELLNIKGSEARPVEITAANGKYSLVYQQYFQNIPVLNAQLRLRVNSKGQVLFISSDFYKISDISVNPNINLETAINIAKSFLPINTEYVSKGGALVIYPHIDSSTLLLGWYFRLLSKGHSIHKEIFVDAHSNKILSMFDAYLNWEIFGTVQTKGWNEDNASNPTPPTNPDATFANSDLNVTIQSIGSDVTDEEGDYTITVPNNTSYTVQSSMTGPKASVTDYAGSEASHSASTSPSSAHNWTWNESAHYNEYNVFYYMNKAWSFWADVTGFNSNYWYSHAMPCSANKGSGTDGGASGTDMEMTPDGCKYAGLVYHEFSHNVLYQSRGYWMGWPNIYTDGYALDEGLADYYACSFKNDPKWCYASSRRLDTKMKYSPPGPPNDIYHEGHYRGQIIGGACWDLKGYIGNALVDDLVYDVVDNYTGYLDRLGDFMDNIFLSDDDNGNIYDGTPHDNEIFDAFNDDHYVLGTIVSGTVYKDTVWQDDIIVLGDVTIPDGITLEIEPDVTVTFAPIDIESNGSSASQSEIIVYGTLKADDATFTGATKGCWYGIRFNSAKSSSYIKNSEIKNAVNGICLENNSNIAIETNKIHDCTSHGLVVSNSSPTVYDNYLYSINHETIFLSSAGGVYRYNTIYSPSVTNVATISAVGTSTANFRGPDADHPYGMNKITKSNGGDAVYMSGGCTAFGWASPEYKTGKNNFYSTNSGYMIHCTAGVTYNIGAKNCFWSKNGVVIPPPSWFYHQNQSYSIDYGSWVGNPFQDAGSSLDKPASITPDWQALSEADDLMGAGRLEEAITKFKEVIEKYPDSEVAPLALSYASEAAWRLSKLEKERDYLQDKCNVPAAGLGQAAVQWLLALELRAGNKEAAEKMVESQKDAILKDAMTLQLAADLRLYYGEKMRSDELLDELQARNASLAPAIASLKRLSGSGEAITFPKSPGQSTATESESTPAIYPNPFNATTKISFKLNEAQNVSMVLYNVLGQKVRTLIDQQMETGKHEAIWDGLNEFGQNVSTGIYLCQIAVGEKRQTLKMVFAK